MPESIKPALTPGNGGVYIALHIQPGARRENISGLYGDALKIALTAPPVDGKANASLLKFLSSRLQVPRNRIELCSGESSRSKRVFVSGITAEDVERLLMK